MITETSSRIVKILSNRDLKLQSFPREDKKSGKCYTSRNGKCRITQRQVHEKHVSIVFNHHCFNSLSLIIPNE